MVFNKFFPILFLLLFYFVVDLYQNSILLDWIHSEESNQNRVCFRNRTFFDDSKALTITSYETTLTASILVLARRRARFASIICLFPSAFLKLASAISRVC